MSPTPRERSGGRILVDQLLIHGADRAFAVPGESFLAALDALHDSPEIDLVVARQEGGAAMMAAANGKLTGRPGLCFVTRGPGATNASAGVHIAFQDSIPMILFIGQVARGAFAREAFQEVEYRQMFQPLAKWVAQIEEAARIPEFVARAYQTATSGRPGPVVLALPEDMLREHAAVPDAGPYQPVQAHPGPAEMARLQALLAKAERPFVMIGGGGWDQATCDAMARFAERNALPVCVTFRCQDYLDNRHPNYVGHLGLGIDPRLRQRIQSSDLILVAGARLGEITTEGYSLIAPPVPDQPLVHVHADATELGRVYQPKLAINAGPRALAEALGDLPASGGALRQAWLEEARTIYLEQLAPPTVPGPLQLGEIMVALRERLPAETIVTNGAGNYTVWANRFYQYRGYGSQVAPTAGSMGYGLPAAVGAKATHPERPVVCFAGDGCFLMHGQELATAVQYGLKIIVLVINNAMYGTIRMHQERAYPGRVTGTDLVNPDFAAYARAFGAQGELVERTEDFAPALERALAAETSALIELRLDPEAITPAATLSEIRARALEQSDP